VRGQLPPSEVSLRLAQTIPTLRALTAGIERDAWVFRPEPGEWSATEIICHLRDVDRRVHLPRLQSFFTEDEPFIPGVVADKWAIEHNYQAQDGPAALDALDAARAELLALLPPASDPVWGRRGRHTFFGPTGFLELVCLVLEHDKIHIEQLQETLGLVLSD